MTTAVEVAEKGHQLAAWVNFNGTLDENSGSLTVGENVLIRASYNVSSIYYNGTGDYTVNFANEMPDENYSLVGTVLYARTIFGINSLTEISARVSTYDEGVGYYNSNPICVAIFR
jgi:hypothetical protein